VARVDGAVVGVLQAADRSADGGGWVRNLGVLTAHRGRGIARVLLDRAFATFHARGFTWAGLGVDRANETGAHRLYESAGMRLQFQADAWETHRRGGAGDHTGRLRLTVGMTCRRRTPMREERDAVGRPGPTPTPPGRDRGGEAA